MMKTTRAFTLMELMVTVAIMALVMAIAIPSISGMKKAGSLGAAGHTVAGLLERARTYAMANNTYVWVGFLAENGGPPLTLTVVASKNGGNNTDAANLELIAKPLRLGNVRLVAANTNDLNTNHPRRPAVPADGQVGDDNFAADVTISVPTGGGASVTFAKLVEFNPRGEACKIGENTFAGAGLPDYLEVALAPARGASVSGQAAAAVQVEGFSGQVRVYLP
jgi:prepilin-type N-terminal cleavage/methylation domain-containing protein